MTESVALEKPKSLLNKKQITDARDIEFREVEVPEWGENGETAWVLIKSLTGKERDAFEASLIQGVGRAQRIDMQNVRAKFCSLIMVDPVTKERMFTKAEIDVLAGKSSAALDRVYQAGMDLSKFTKEDVEELVGKSDSGQFDV